MSKDQAQEFRTRINADKSRSGRSINHGFARMSTGQKGKIRSYPCLSVEIRGKGFVVHGSSQVIHNKRAEFFYRVL